MRTTALRGSSPRMRGAHPSGLGLDRGEGIIPADAGSTRRMAPGPAPSMDHPRGCGEHFPGINTFAPVEGSSPRMRGAHCELTTKPISDGIIPADAGSTLWESTYPR